MTYVHVPCGDEDGQGVEAGGPGVSQVVLVVAGLAEGVGGRVGITEGRARVCALLERHGLFVLLRHTWQGHAAAPPRERAGMDDTGHAAK